MACETICAHAARNCDAVFLSVSNQILVSSSCMHWTVCWTINNKNDKWTFRTIGEKTKGPFPSHSSVLAGEFEFYQVYCDESLGSHDLLRVSACLIHWVLGVAILLPVAFNFMDESDSFFYVN